VSVHDPTDPVGRLLFNVLAMIAESESDLIKARTEKGSRSPEPPASSAAYRVGMSDASYGEGERVLGPPQGTYDAVRVGASARQQDPGLPTETALLLAQESLDHLRVVRELDAPELARRLMADHDTTGATAANMVATAAVEFCRAYGVQL